MALPFLPSNKIETVFTRLRVHATTQPLMDLMMYVADTWVYGTVWPPSCWSVYNMAIRTNNDLEGWHNRINRRANGRWAMPFYLLIGLLHREATLSMVQVRLVSERKLQRFQRRKYRELQGRVFELWDSYRNGEKSARQLLKACSLLNGPCRQA